MNTINGNAANSNINNNKNGETFNGPILDQENSVKAMNVATAAFANSAINTALPQQQAKARQTYTSLQRQQEQQFAMIQQQQRQQNQSQQILQQKIDASMSSMNGKTSIDPMIYQQLLAKSQQQQLAGVSMIHNSQEVSSPSIESFQSQIKKQTFQQKHSQQGQDQTHSQPSSVVSSQNAIITPQQQQQQQSLGSPIVAIPISPHVMNNAFMQQQLTYMQTKQQAIANMTNSNSKAATAATATSITNTVNNNSNNDSNNNNNNNENNGSSDNINNINNNGNNNTVNNNNNDSNNNTNNNENNSNSDNINNINNNGNNNNINNNNHNNNNENNNNNNSNTKINNNNNGIKAATAMAVATAMKPSVNGVLANSGLVISTPNGLKQPITPATSQFNITSPQNTPAINKKGTSNHFHQHQQHLATPVMHPSQIVINGNNIAESSVRSSRSSAGSPMMMVGVNQQTSQSVAANRIGGLQQQHKIANDRLSNVNISNFSSNNLAGSPAAIITNGPLPDTMNQTDTGISANISSTQQSQMKNIRNLKLNMARQQSQNSSLLAFRKQFSRVAKLRLIDFCNDLSSVRVPTQQPVQSQSHQQSQIQSIIRNSSYALSVWQNLVNKYFNNTSSSCLRYSQLVGHKRKLMNGINNRDNNGDSMSSSNFYEFAYPLIAHFFNSLLSDGVYKLELKLNNIHTKFLPSVSPINSQQSANAFNHSEIFLEASGDINFLFADGSSISSQALFKGRLGITKPQNNKPDMIYDISIFDNENSLKFNMVDLQVIKFFSQMTTQSLDRFITNNPTLSMSSSKLVLQQNFKALKATSPFGLQSTCVRNLQILDIMSILKPLMEFQSASSINAVDEALSAYIHESLKASGRNLVSNFANKSSENGNISGGNIRSGVLRVNSNFDPNNNFNTTNASSSKTNNNNGSRERINLNVSSSAFANGNIANMSNNAVVSTVNSNLKSTQNVASDNISTLKDNNNNKNNGDDINSKINSRNKRTSDISVSPKTKLQRLKN